MIDSIDVSDIFTPEVLSKYIPSVIADKLAEVQPMPCNLMKGLIDALDGKSFAFCHRTKDNK